ncbi:MAG: helix-turn-helix domain-containing protein [Nitriliruptorales bacterium]|nr:helix-turn-helix domain-containing protein [Nitriliruptorales bacterium]
MDDPSATDGAGAPSRLLSPRQLAGYLGVPVATIYQWRYRGEGPPGFKFGNHVRYRWSDVEAWIADHADSRTRR